MPAGLPTGLAIGPHRADAPVVLAPMAGITNQAYRRLCREFAGARGAFFVSEMVTTRALVERNSESLRLIAFDADESPRSVQLYGVDPATVGRAVQMIVDEDRADHIDLNFGCPVPKVTRRGGGSALPWKTSLFAAIVAEAVRRASPAGIPVTVKMRMGIDADHLTYLQAGPIAEAEGVAAVALHARTAEQFYSGQAAWQAVARLKEVVTSVPVLGNGDIWTADDALRLVRETGCDGVVVGRGCLGRPWLFADLAAAFAGRPERLTPTLGEAVAVMRRHLVHLEEHFRTTAEEALGRLGGRAPTPREDPAQAERRACRDIRKHVAWYLKGYPVPQGVRAALGTVATLEEFDALCADLDPASPYPAGVADQARGRLGSPKAVQLPHGWLQSRDLDGAAAAAVRDAEVSASGG